MTDKKQYVDSEIENLKSRLERELKKTDSTYQWKVKKIIDSIVEKCELDEKSKKHAGEKKSHHRKFHPVRPVRGEIYNVLLSPDNVGTELNNNHLCVIISNPKKNIYSEKVNVVPIEGDGRRIDPMNNIQLTNEDLEFGTITKDPSRIIGGDIMTIDKARIDRKVAKLSPEKLEEVMAMVTSQLGI
ncbi:hypothetical protein CF394_03445 [Tetzosporium hominis]|uniref:MazF family transcriptional regulator n=1 Tax=Tetzosporium hominis TaxID=2020506 RepID=A0A264W7E4_9BACL|nr:type II toxin-antitoxin system PemK/MazF family toxin [Tetzosporium hominis]OZS78957.1 hypothetical protein CF394_03445 [Tetzosporium hominis]